MKYLLHLLIPLFLFLSCKAVQKDTTEFAPIVLKMKETSLYTEKVDWKMLNKEYLRLTEGKNSVEELKEGLQYLINGLGDKHAHIRSPKDHSIIVSYQGKIESKLERDADFVNNVINDITAQFSYKKLDGEIGYLKVVGIGAGDVKAQADTIRAGLLRLKEQGIEKWIVDLRYNGGGNMEPMISGLAPLIGDGFIGGAAIGQDQITRTYALKNGQFYNWERLACEMPDEPKIDQKERVAVLLSRYTISSGEVLAVAFKGRPNTRFIGEASAGYTTGNGYEVLNEDIALIISQDVFMDRNKKVYFENVPVDEEIPFQHNLDLKNDKQIEAARRFLNQ